MISKISLIRIRFESNNVSWFCVFLVGFAFLLSLSLAKNLNMHKNPGTWATYAVPHSLSELSFKHGKKYTSNKTVRDTYTGVINSTKSKDDINLAINTVLHLDKNKLGDGLFLWENEDKGIIDFVSMAFNVFGFKVQSILYCYFFIMFVSCAAFMFANFNGHPRLIVLQQFLVVLYLIIPTISLHPQLGSLMAPRVFPVLSVVASLHCVLFSLQPKHNKSELMLIIVQVLIVTFVIHMRIVTYWQLLAIGIAGFIGVFRLHFNKTPQNNKWLPFAATFKLEVQHGVNFR